MRLVTYLIISTFFSLNALSQVNIQFIPEVQGRNIDGLFNARIISATSINRAALTITLTEVRKGRVLTIRTAGFSIKPGSNIIPAYAVKPAKIQFFSNSVADQVQKLGFLPEGEYEYCFTLTPEQGNYDPETPAEQCYSAELTPFSALNLTEPADKEEICQPRPLFTWQPSFPVVPGAAYQLQLCEIKEHQSAAEALNYNLPLISQSGIISPALPFPGANKELKQGKKYAWQVTLYKDQTVLNRSEIWEFTMNCKDSVESVTALNYRNITDLSKGNFYESRGWLNFYIQNPYGEQSLHYKINGLTDPKATVKKLPELVLKNGINQISIDLRNSRLRDGFFYLLTVELPNGEIKRLRFLYEQE